MAWVSLDVLYGRYMMGTYCCLLSALVDVVVVLVLVTRLSTATDTADDFDDVEAVEVIVEVEEDVLLVATRFTFGAVAVAVTTVANLAEQKLAASGTPARGFNRP